MRASKRSLKGLLALTVLGATMLPGIASAAAPLPVADVVVFGNKVPAFAPWGVVGDPGWDDPATGASTVYANSRPLDQVSFGGTYYFGVAEPDIIVDIHVSDGVNSFVTSTWTAPTGSTEAIDGYDAGWFGVGVPSGFPRPTQDDYNVIYPTELGVHQAETDLDINPDGSASDDAAHRGPSTITFTFIARNPVTNETALPVEREITKYAGTQDDVTAPAVTSIKYPPAHWCHTGGLGANFPTQPGQNLGGQEDGRCSSFAQAPIGAVPDLTWVLCTRELSNPHHILMPSLPGNPFRGNYCRRDPNAHVPHGEAPIQGIFTDLPNGARGIGSEIASVTVKVFSGESVWLDLTPKLATFRAGPTFGFSTTLRIQDLPPNYPTGAPYQVRISATDAWGRVTNIASPNITVYPY